MTEEEKYINNLFQAAKNEPPKRSYKHVANHFKKSVLATAPTTSSSNLLLKYISLNTLFMTIICSIILTVFLWSNTTNIEQTTILKKAAQTTKFEQSIPPQKELTVNIQTKEKATLSIPLESSTIKVEKKNLFISSATNQKIVQKKGTSSPISATKTIHPKKEQSTSLGNLSITTVEKKLPKSIIPTTDTGTAIPTSLANKIITVNQAAVTSNVTNTKRNIEQFKLLRLTYTDNYKTTTTFLEKIKSYGFSLTEKVNRNSGKIERINLHISLYKGLDWKVKLKNFEVFELKILLDEYKNPVGLAYRLSDTSKFSEPIPLNSRARSSHKFSKNNSKGNHTFTKSIRH